MKNKLRYIAGIVAVTGAFYACTPGQGKLETLITDLDGFGENDTLKIEQNESGAKLSVSYGEGNRGRQKDEIILDRGTYKLETEGDKVNLVWTTRGGEEIVYGVYVSSGTKRGGMWIK